MAIKVLIIDDDPAFIERVKFGLKPFRFIPVSNIQMAKEMIDDTIDVVMLDLNLDPSTDTMEGLELLDYLKKEYPHIPVTVITGYGNIDVAVDAMKRGADDFLKKRDMDIIEWRKRIEILAKTKQLKEQVADYEHEKYQFIGNTPEIIDIKKHLRTIGNYPDITVLIRGETGVGKEVAAKYLHSHSPRCNKPFVVVNISSFQPSLLESALFGHRKGSFTGADRDRLGFFRKADGGVLFLDEIGDLSLEAQGKILRFLQDRTINIVGEETDLYIDVQVIAATNKNLESLIVEGTFREDLYYRIKNYTVLIPPLRHRTEDIPPLINHFATKLDSNKESGKLSKKALEILMNYAWPGNIRELKNTIDYALIKSGQQCIEPCHLPADIISLPKTQKALYDPDIEFPLDIEERAKVLQLTLIDRALEVTFGNKSKTAEFLNLDLDKLMYKIKSNHTMILNGPYESIKMYYKSLFVEK